MAEIRIVIKKTYDPLTWKSYLHPEAPWVGIHPADPAREKEEIVSLAIARLERLMAEYVNRGVSGSSVLIGGDRGAGKTSLVLKVIERLRRRSGIGTTIKEEHSPRYNELLRFPRPLLVRVHGPILINSAAEDGHRSKEALRIITESVHRSLVDEFGEIFASLAKTPEEREQAAQFRMELDEGPNPAQLREMWTLFSPKGHEPEPKLPHPDDWPELRAKVPDQAYLELVAIASSIQLVREIRQHRADEDSRRDDRDTGKKDPAPPKPVADDARKDWWLWKYFGRFMIDGGKLINPLAGLVVATIVFFSVVRSAKDFPLAGVTAMLSGFSTTVLLNFIAARRQANAMLADSKLESLERMLPELLRRIEKAGLFPIIVIDELDKADSENERLESKMDDLIRRLKYFVADQAFVCFLVGRRYYEHVLQHTRGEASGRQNVDTFYTDRILVSHTPDSLLRYLGELLQPEDDDESRLALAFLKHLYLYRAKGHLADIQETIAADHRLNDTVNLLEDADPVWKVPSYRNQVFYQLAVHAVLNDPHTRTFLRQKPDRLQSLNRVLYGPARIWEEHKWSFVLDDLWQGVSPSVPGDTDEFKAPVDFLLGYLMEPQSLWPRILRDPLLADSRRLRGELKDVNELLVTDKSQGEMRYFWTVKFALKGRTDISDPDRPSMMKFRGQDGEERKRAYRGIRAVWALLRDLSGEQMELADLFSLEPSSGGDRLVDYTFAAGLDWTEIQDLEDEEWRDREVCDLYVAMQGAAIRLKYILLAGCLGCRPDKHHFGLDDFEGLISRVRASPGIRQNFEYALAETVDSDLDRLEAARRATAEMRRSVDFGYGQAAPENFSAWSDECSFVLRRLRRR